MFVVTGASSGIGRATACALARRQRTVLAVGRDVARLRSLVAEHPDTIESVVADLSLEEDIETIGARLRSVATLDGIVHAAGSTVPLASYGHIDGDALSRHVGVHVAAPIALNNRLRRKLTGARILFVDSHSAQAPRVGWAAYSIVKAAAQMAARVAAAELHESTVIRVFPGGVRTPLIESVLASSEPNETADLFRALDAGGQLADADLVGEYLADLLLDATEEELAARDSWDVADPADRIAGRAS